MSLTNPFTPASEVQPHLKVLLYGGWGTGKTWFGLHCPPPIAVFDTEGGTVLYAKQFEFDRVGSKSFRDLEVAVEYIERNPEAYGTFFIDPVTVIYQVLQDAALRARVAKKARKANADFDPDLVDLEPLDWNRIKRNYNNLMDRLVNLPCHVVVSARERDDVEFNFRTGESTRKGVKPDAEKGTAYHFDCVLHCVKADNKRVFVVEKARGVVGKILQEGARFTDPTFDELFGPVLELLQGGTAERGLPTDDQASEKDTQVFGVRLAGTALAAEIMETLTAKGYDPEELRVSKGWPAFTDLPEKTARELLTRLNKPVVAKPPVPQAPAGPPQADDSGDQVPGDQEPEPEP